MASVPKLVKMPSAAPIAALLSAEDVAGITELSIETLAQWRSQRKGIPYVKISRNCVRYRPADLEAWLAGHIVRVKADASIAERRL